MDKIKLAVSINQNNKQVSLVVKKKDLPKKTRNQLMHSKAVEVMFGDFE